MDTIGQEIIQGLQEAVAYMDNTTDKANFAVTNFTPPHLPITINVREIRQKLGLSQAGFATTFGFSLYTLRNWEQGKRQPDSATRAYLKVISVAPDIVKKALTVE